jgi:hypothetical protein
MNRIFLLSPANSTGKRARMLLRRNARFALAQQVRSEGAPIGDVFAFLSGLYFRGKLAYARTFADPPTGLPGVFVITSNRGLVPADTVVTRRDLQRFARNRIDRNEERYWKPLQRDASQLAAYDCEVVLLGSVATGKYVDVLQECLGAALRFPEEFIGRGDMSRGGLLLRCAADGCELTYMEITGALRRGKRPPKLPPRPDLRPPKLLHANFL